MQPAAAAAQLPVRAAVAGWMLHGQVPRRVARGRTRRSGSGEAADIAHPHRELAGGMKPVQHTEQQSQASFLKLAFGVFRARLEARNGSSINDDDVNSDWEDSDDNITQPAAALVAVMAHAATTAALTALDEGADSGIHLLGAVRRGGATRDGVNVALSPLPAAKSAAWTAPSGTQPNRAAQCEGTPIPTPGQLLMDRGARADAPTSPRSLTPRAPATPQPPALPPPPVGIAPSANARSMRTLAQPPYASKEAARASAVMLLALASLRLAVITARAHAQLVAEQFAPKLQRLQALPRSVLWWMAAQHAWNHATRVVEAMRHSVRACSAFASRACARACGRCTCEEGDAASAAEPACPRASVGVEASAVGRMRRGGQLAVRIGKTVLQRALSTGVQRTNHSAPTSTLDAPAPVNSASMAARAHDGSAAAQTVSRLSRHGEVGKAKRRLLVLADDHAELFQLLKLAEERAAVGALPTSINKRTALDAWHPFPLRKAGNDSRPSFVATSLSLNPLAASTGVAHGQMDAQLARQLNSNTQMQTLMKLQAAQATGSRGGDVRTLTSVDAAPGAHAAAATLHSSAMDAAGAGKASGAGVSTRVMLSNPMRAQRDAPLRIDRGAAHVGGGGMSASSRWLSTSGARSSISGERAGAGCGWTGERGGSAADATDKERAHEQADTSGGGVRAPAAGVQGHMRAMRPTNVRKAKGYRL
ncbi:hypothetical protein EON66_03030 [archaeon]|nr:MAG: hypothetical protein EON66_03030 [archaeon]